MRAPSKRYTTPELTSLIGSEIAKLAVIVPANPMNSRETMKNVHDTEKKLRELAYVLWAFKRSADGGGLDDANQAWQDYQARFHPAPPNTTPEDDHE